MCWPELDPNHTDAWATRAKITACVGQPAATIEQVQRALQLRGIARGDLGDYGGIDDIRAAVDIRTP